MIGKIALFSAMAALLSATPAPSQDKTLTIRSDSWMPYNGAPSSSEPGFCIELAKAIFEPEGWTVDYRLLPWPRALKEVGEGKFLAVVGATKDDCPEFVFPKTPLSESQFVFLVKKGNPWVYKGVESLKGVRIGVAADYAYSDELDKYIAGNKDPQAVQALSGDNVVELNLKKLAAGRIDAFPEDRNVAQWNIKSIGIDEGGFAEAGALGEPDPIYIAFSPKHPESKKLADIFDKGFMALEASGKLSELRKKYNLK